jgi:uridine phosphorylase
MIRNKVISLNVYSFNLDAYIAKTHGPIFMKNIKDSKVVLLYLPLKEIAELRRSLITINRCVLYDEGANTFYIVGAKYPNHKEKYLNILRHFGVTNIEEQGDKNIVFNELRGLAKVIANLAPKTISFSFLNNLTEATRLTSHLFINELKGFPVGLSQRNNNVFLDISSVYGSTINCFLMELLKEHSPERIVYYGLAGGLSSASLYTAFDVGIGRGINNEEVVRDNKGATCMSVNSVFDETDDNVRKWSKEGVTLVEQEIFHLFSAIRDSNYNGKVNASVVVSDVFGGRDISRLNQDKVNATVNKGFLNIFRNIDGFSE